MRNALACVLVLLWTGETWAQPGATGPVATLNAEAKEFSETDPGRSLAITEVPRLHFGVE